MHITQVSVNGTIKPDGVLELNQPLDMPPGKVQVTVQSLETPTTTKESMLEFLGRIRAAQQERRHVTRTREEIDTELNALRQEAEEEILEIENIRSTRDGNTQ